MNTLVSAGGGAQPGGVALAGFEEQVRDLRRQSRSEATLKAYKSDLRQFAKFCELHNQPQNLPVPAFIITSFISWMDQRGLKAVTISRRLSALSALHVKGEFEDTTKALMVTETMEGLRRARASAGESASRARPMDPLLLRQIASKLGTRLVDRRDWAMALVGFSGLLRRSEIAALNMADLEWRTEGLVLHIRRSKTDQTGEGAVVGIPMANEAALCPVGALKKYLEAAGHGEGPVFRNHGSSAKHERINGRVVAYAIKKLAKLVHMDPATFSGHSLRAGGATTMAERGVDLGMIVSHGRWTSPQTVSKHYVRPASALGENNPMRRIL